MTSLIRCKACGYVTREGKIKDVCPACGVPAKMFGPYTDTISPKRRLILGLHLHPIMVHFPQAFSITLFLLLVLSHFVYAEIKWMYLYAIIVISFFLPFSVILALLTGLFDGKIRFRKVTTPLLKKKMILGVLLLITSIALAFVTFSRQLTASPAYEIITLLTILAVACGAGLGLIGGQLTDAKLPG
ncbi:MAG: rubrerythrin [Deltaproteobacteria bacterium]|nr:rubrerythrin [Deltaproteobacteria bacterium]